MCASMQSKYVKDKKCSTEVEYVQLQLRPLSIQWPLYVKEGKEQSVAQNVKYTIKHSTLSNNSTNFNFMQYAVCKSRYW